MPVAFESEGDFDRMANVVRDSEGNTRSIPKGRHLPLHTPGQHLSVDVKITNQTPDADGFYEAWIVVRHIADVPNSDFSAVTSTQDSDWYQVEQGFVITKSRIGAPLTKDWIYSGYVGGNKNKSVVVWVEGDTVEVGQPSTAGSGSGSGSGGTLMDWEIVRYDPGTDSFVVGEQILVKDANA